LNAAARVRTLLGVALLLVSCAVSAADEKMRLVHPEDSGLTIRKVAREPDVVASFAGRFWITGTVVARWPGGRDTDDDKPDLILVPDAASRRRLPYWRLYDPPHSNRYRVDSLWLTNEEQALRSAFSAKDRKLLLARQVDQVRASGTFLVEAYEVGVECDAPWARARLVAVKVPERLAARHLDVVEGC
jgi:hypothetical protein